MILNDINYKMPIFKDCTLGEVMVTGSFVFITEITILSVITKLCFGYGLIGTVLTILSFFHLTKYLLGRLQRVKYGKPHGYYKQLLIKKLISVGVVRPIYITRIGRWSVRRPL